jgi:hypothetical protein
VSINNLSTIQQSNFKDMSLKCEALTLLTSKIIAIFEPVLKLQQLLAKTKSAINVDEKIKAS